MTDIPQQRLYPLNDPRAFGMPEGSLNLYLVVSEEIRHDSEGWYDPPEWSRIAELVVARNHSQARYLAWQCGEGGFCGYCLADMPKSAVRLKRRDVPGPIRIATTEHWADSDAELEELWDVGKALHIGYV